MRQIEIRRLPDTGKWSVLLVPPSGGGYVLVAYRLKRHAKIAARALGIYLKTEVVETDRRGRYVDRNSYGNDRSDRPG